MLLKYFYDDKLAQASYLVACQGTGEAVIIDPMRDIDPYLQEAKKEGLKIVGSIETHIHADFVSGSRELAARTGAKLFLSDEGDQDWKYENLDSVEHQLLKNGESFKIGKVSFHTLHTPGHTPESLSFLLTDEATEIKKPMGIFTGDFVFVGDVGRPDLLEKAAGVTGSTEKAAKDMYDSIQAFKELPDYLQIWPGHGAGSACGKSLGAVPTSTVGYEKQVNWALKETDKNSFIHQLLENQPEPPTYFARMKRVNKAGAPLIKDLPELSSISSFEELGKLLEEEKQVIDTRDSAIFAEGHIPGTINIPLNKTLSNWAGWLVKDQGEVYFIAEEGRADEAITALYSIGVDNLAGYAQDSIVNQADHLETYKQISPDEAEKLMNEQNAQVVDVRSQSEWESGHIEGAQHIMLGELPDRVDEVPKDKTIISQCGSGMRSAIGVSILQASGITNVLNLEGGYSGWMRRKK
ncbi:rhodanese-like domain-containing protein [Fictibacillus fluitans]|uniref:Rhodanese-like domain-containing protein n=1 Tax=Fictibacillus fluitans TaxID=3058422 RepID=A0ABT8HRD0_9BACL|nr:rhodanese-like domain-containing protein [Fictibacillus sp. NE201]MDN4523333.1 rhodanese-like domain-containing protein [Fictibacillus sp. NE201]